MGPGKNGRARIAAGILLVPAALTILLGWELKEQCTNHQWDGFQYRHSCYNDVYALYFFRDLQPDPVTHKHPARFPYLDSTPASRGAEKDIEYPVATGLYMGTVAKATQTPKGYFNSSAVGLALAGLIAVYATTLVAGDRSRVLYFALAPTLFLYAFHNWDLLAVATTALAVLAFYRRKPLWTGAALGIGASLKLYPAFLLPVFAISLWREYARERRPLGPGAVEGKWSEAVAIRDGIKMVAAFLVALLALNLPVLLANRSGWWYPWRFQSVRFTNFETVWYMIYRHLGRYASQGFWFNSYPKMLNLVTGGLFVLGAATLVVLELKRERFRAMNVSLGILLIWLITAKVFSPQYMLWLLPFFALVEIPWFGFVAFAIVDAGVWAAISWYFLAASADPSRVTLQLNWLEAAVFARYAVLAWLLWLSRRAPERVLSDAVGQASPASVSALASEA